MSEILSYTCAESNSHTIKIHFIRLRTTANGTKYLKLYNKKVTAPFIGEYCPSLGYLRMLSKQILFLVRASVDIPTRDNIHRYQLKPVTTPPPPRAPPPPQYFITEGFKAVLQLWFIIMVIFCPLFLLSLTFCLPCLRYM